MLDLLSDLSAHVNGSDECYISLLSKIRATSGSKRLLALANNVVGWRDTARVNIWERVVGN
jgi:hypothetical protein